MSNSIWTEIVPSALSGASLIAVIWIGLRSVRATDEATDVMRSMNRETERSANATERSASTTELSVEATGQLVGVTRDLSAAGMRDDHLRRLARVLDVVIEMRQTFNQIHILGHPDLVDSQPQTLAKLALCRRLEAAVVLVEDDFPSGSAVSKLINQQGWSSGVLEQGIEDVKGVMRAVSASGVQPSRT
jgi:hypothetical protein